MNWRRLVLTIFAVVGLAVAAGCGSDDSSTTTNAAESSSAASTTSGGIKVDPRTIGVVNLVRQSPAEDKIDKLYEQMGKTLGWDVKVVDGAGDPQKIARAVQNFVNTKVDAIITTSTEAAIIRSQLRAAKQKGIPVISTNGGTTKSPDLFTAQYEEDEYKMGKQLADQMKQDQPNPKIANLKTKIAISGVLRDKALHAVFPKSAFVAEQEVDLTNPVVSTQKILNDILTAHPDTTAVAAVYDNMSQASATTIRSKKSDAKLYNYFTTEQNVKNLQGDTALQAVSDVNLPHTGAVAFDQLLAKFQKDTPIDPNALTKNPLTYEVVTRDNIDEKLGGKAEVFPNAEILKPFIAKWSKEYPG
jgi:ABC-type sugar transport system substrate-binding protein